MNLNNLIILLPIAFALHNLEETIGMEIWSKSFPSFVRKPVKTFQFAIAVSLFSILGCIIVFAKGFYPTEKLYYLFISGFAGMLFLNVFFPHLIALLYLKKYAPGIITGLFINLPLSILILLKIYTSSILVPQEILMSVASGGVVGVILAYTFLKIGSLIKANVFIT